MAKPTNTRKFGFFGKKVDQSKPVAAPAVTPAPQSPAANTTKAPAAAVLPVSAPPVSSSPVAVPPVAAPVAASKPTIKPPARVEGKPAAQPSPQAISEAAYFLWLQRGGSEIANWLEAERSLRAKAAAR